MPLETLESNFNKNVILVTKKGNKYIGKMVNFDEHGNILLTDTALQTEESTQFLGSIIVNNANIVIIDLENV